MINLTSETTVANDTKKPDVKQLILHHKNTWLFKGDSLNENLFDKEFIDLIVTSPPYNVGIEYNSNDDTIAYEKYIEFNYKWLWNCYQWSKPQARLLMNVPLDKNKGGNKSVGVDLTKIAQ